MAGAFRPLHFLGSNEATYGLREGAVRQASFAEFKMLMGLDDEALKRYGLPRPTVERALKEVYQTVVRNKEKSRPLGHDVDATNE
jgi:hypothetical protein